MHEGVIYSCKLCVNTESLKIHIQSIHEGVKQACDQCDYKGNSQKSLKLHIKSRHDGIMFTCKYCQRKFTLQHTLKNMSNLYI